MRNSIERYKESLSRIASDVLDAAQELDIPEAQPQSDVPAFSARRRSSRFTPPLLANGTDPGSHDEIAKYKEHIQKLQASEAEIKALSFNYAAMLKEKEEQLSKLREENGSLKKNLEGVIEQVPSRPQNNAFQGNSSSGNHLPKYSVFKKDGFNNGASEADPFDGMRRKSAISQGNEKEHEDLVEEIRNLMEVKARNESEIKILIAQLENERENSLTIKLKLQEEHKLNESSQKELHGMKVEKERIFTEIKELQKELHEKISELERVQMELNRRNMEEERNESLESLKNDILTLEKENAKLKVEKNELETNMKHHMKSAVEKTSVPDTKSVYKDMSKINEVTNKMTVRMQKLEETLKDTCKERDKALQELARLKQHLLDKELEDSDKMDEDNKVIEELRATAEYQRAHIVQLEKTLKQEIVKREDLKKLASDEHQKSNEVINELNQKLASCMSIVHSKNVELQNLQTALGQFYAESEAKERLGRDLTLAREESNKLFESLKVANHGLELCKREKEEIFAKLSHAERMLLDGTRTIQKMEEENTKLRGALEQSMMRVNRMSLDSDNSVDRRIVIKLLVTYFQRNHSKEVLDLMVRMLGFSDEDKKRIGFAQNTAGKGVVRGVLGLPGRLVGGILGGSSPEDPSKSPDNQSFADLWVDFLLKETEERERRESKEAARMSSITQESSTSSTSKSVPELGTKLPSSIGFPSTHYKANHLSGPTVTKEQQSFEEHLDAEFATVTLKSSVSPSAVSAFSRLPPKY